ncbi:MAG: hypothetical protein NC090_07105 [Anaeroplasma bactoclasticum]|nr:hypothetical protein [Anaeroplasma bactoclasticum]
MSRKISETKKHKEVININIIKGSYIVYEICEDSYRLSANIQGFKSFVRILNKLIYRNYSSVRLFDFNYHNIMIHEANYFFDEPSNSLEIYVMPIKEKDMYFEEYVGLNDSMASILYINKNNLKKIKNQIITLINSSENNNFIVPINTPSKNLVFNKIIHKGIRI